MPKASDSLSSSNECVDTRCFGLRIESQLLQLAVASRQSDGRYQLTIDEVRCSTPGGWLTATGVPVLLEALQGLIDRHQMREGRVAISLDGQYCVTRIAMGTSEEVDHELAMQAGRVPRYLQLGPGEKVTGCSRQPLANNLEYAVTGVVNRSVVQLLYDAVREVDLQVTWVEPSLVSVARMLGQAQIGGENPIMIADGTGNQWDVGIACRGRLLLDYRPAGATTEEGLRNALDGHITRLKRFCLRHRGIVTGEMTRLMICGSDDRPALAIDALGDSLGVQPEVLRVPNLSEMYELDREKRESRSVPAVATVLPLLMGVPESDVPDLLTEVRRAPDLPWVTRFIRNTWPAMVAAFLLALCFSLLTGQRKRHAGIIGRENIVSEIEAVDARFEQLSSKRELLTHLQQIERLTEEPDWNVTFKRIAQSLPDLARLEEFRVERGSQIVIDGCVLHEPLIYRLVVNLRKLPNVNEVALIGTTPDETIRGTRFNIRIELATPTDEMENSSDWATHDD